MRRKDLELVLSTKTNTNMFLINNGLNMTSTCPTCSTRVVIDLEQLSYSCRRQRNGFRCCFYKSVKFHGLSLKNNLSIAQYITIIFEWSRGTEPKHVAYDLDTCVSTINRLYMKLNGVAVENMPFLTNREIGGENVIVEVDESKFVRRKNNKGRVLVGEEWIFGGVEKGNWNNYFFEFVKDRKASTLAEVLSRRIAPGSIVHSDEWPAYKTAFKMLSAYDFQHKTVCHSRNFVNPANGVHTQNIEGFWSWLKREIKKTGANRGKERDILGKLYGICYKRSAKYDSFETIIKRLIS